MTKKWSSGTMGQIIHSFDGVMLLGSGTSWADRSGQIGRLLILATAPYRSRATLWIMWPAQNRQENSSLAQQLIVLRPYPPPAGTPPGRAAIPLEAISRIRRLEDRNNSVSVSEAFVLVHEFGTFGPISFLQGAEAFLQTLSTYVNLKPEAEPGKTSVSFLCEDFVEPRSGDVQVPVLTESRANESTSSSKSSQSSSWRDFIGGVASNLRAGASNLLTPPTSSSPPSGEPVVPETSGFSKESSEPTVWVNPVPSSSQEALMIPLNAVVLDDLIELSDSPATAHRYGSSARSLYPSIETTEVGDFEILGSDFSATPTSADWSEDRDDDLLYSTRAPHREYPLTRDIFESLLDDEGRVKDEAEVRRLVFYGGIEDSLRPEVWKYLVGMYSFSSTLSERAAVQRKLDREYGRLRSIWSEMSPEQEEYNSLYRDRRSRIEKDVVRTDRDHPLFEDPEGRGISTLRSVLLTYCLFNYDLGYVQGMSDIVAQLIAVFDSEADVFWCFHGMMKKRLAVHFTRTQKEMHAELEQVGALVRIAHPRLWSVIEKCQSENMFFAFRWLLIDFKREFDFEDVFVLWDTIWAEHLTKYFSYFLGLSMLLLRSKALMKHVSDKLAGDELLQFANGLSKELTLVDVLCKAEWAFFLCESEWNEERGCVGPKTSKSLNPQGVNGKEKKNEVVAGAIPVDSRQKKVVGRSSEEVSAFEAFDPFQRVAPTKSSSSAVPFFDFASR